MVARIRLGNIRELAALFPVELTRLNDNPAESCTVAADKLCSGMYNDISAVLNRSYKVGSAECVVDNKRKPVLMSDFRYSVDVGDIAVRITEGFEINRSGIFLNGTLELL